MTKDELDELEYPARVAKDSGFKSVQVDVDDVLGLIVAARAGLTPLPGQSKEEP